MKEIAFIHLWKYLKLPVCLLIVCCNTNSGKEPADTTSNTNLIQKGNGAAFLENTLTNRSIKNIRVIYQDSEGNYWFGSDGYGVYKYDGKKIIQYTHQDGLTGNQVQSIQQDKAGNLWFGTGGYEVSRFDGKYFKTFTSNDKLQFTSHLTSVWQLKPDDLWFGAGAGAYRYSDSTFTYLPFPETVAAGLSPEQLSAYAVYYTFKDSKGNVWFGTQTKGVCRFNGKTFTWFTDKGLSGPAVRAIYEDKHGNLWFGNNGYGLFKYDGKTLVNFTAQHKLGNPEFMKKGSLSVKSNPGTMARVWTIAEDKTGNLWIGTIDAGVWRFDGKNLTNYTVKDGLPSDVVNTIFKDKLGRLWFGTEGTGLVTFNGTSFKLEL
ncbi:hypothetical protein GCM10023149_10370 [Mucilaginibacter gynuensis]|uniref:Two component regulator with propeller domain n=1 Tax=Mucilaginibacter gynuensis TaxID=1302236 RepID=A0ABP8FZL0_9SPHI